MKHGLKIVLLLIGMFFVAQLIGLYVSNAYLPETVQVFNNETQTFENQTVYDLPYGVEPPADNSPTISAISIIVALLIAVFLMFTLIKIKAEVFLKIWFFVVVILGIAIALNAFLIELPNSAIIALIIAVPFAAIKIFQRNIIVHNATELFIYPGIAAVFIPLLNVWATVILLLLISAYDIYAVWHAGFMQKMAKYQIEKLKVFSGFFVPYLGKKEKALLKKSQNSKATKGKQRKINVNLAILGGGDVVFPIILSGVVLASFGIFHAFIISVGATLALTYLFYASQKGKFYPAMPYITVGCLIGLGVGFLL